MDLSSSIIVAVLLAGAPALITAGGILWQGRGHAREIEKLRETVHRISNEVQVTRGDLAAIAERIQSMRELMGFFRGRVE